MNEQANIESDMLPFTLRELVAMVMQKKTLTLEDALYYIYSSNLYNSLLDKETKMWYLSTLSLYEILEKEKSEKRKQERENSKKLLFKVFCLENYREIKKLSAKETLQVFTMYNVFGFLNETFEILHTQSTTYILDSISTYIKNKRNKRSHKNCLPTMRNQIS